MENSSPVAAKLLEHARQNPKPNFTQYQLALAEAGAGPNEHRELRHIMETKFALPSLDDLMITTS